MTGRLRSRLYLFNSFGMLVIYTVVVILNFVLFVEMHPSLSC